MADGGSDPLVEGYRRFRAQIWPGERARYEALANWGQSPDTMIIACSDSRVDPQTIFGAVPGEMFVLRNVAAIVPPYQPDAGGFHGSSAAIEFAVRVLKVERIVVLGHAQCGGVKAMAIGAPPQARDFVAAWVDIARPALGASGGPAKSLDDVEAGVVRVSLANLMTFPWVADAAAKGKLSLQGFRFDIHTGVLTRVLADGVEPVG
jgi:carbonic anhydrase